MSADLEGLQKAAAKDPTLLFKLADSLVAAGRAEEAVRVCRRGLLERPDDVPLRLALGRALSATGHLEEAQAALLDAASRERKLRSAGGAQSRPKSIEVEAVEDDPPSFDSAPTREASLDVMKLALEESRRVTSAPRKQIKQTMPYGVSSLADEPGGDTDKVTANYGPEHTDRLRNEYGFQAAQAHDTAPEGVDLERVAASLLGNAGGGSAADWGPEDVAPEPPVDEMARAWDARRARAFAWLWVGLGLVTVGSVGGYIYKESLKRKQLDALVAQGEMRAIDATYEAERDARDLWAQALRIEPKARRYFALTSLGNARLVADHGADTDAAAWAMMKRAEREEKRHPEPPGSDPATDRVQRLARALLALERGEACTPTEDADGDVAARCALQRGDTDAARRILNAQIKDAPGKAALRSLLVLASLELGAGDLDAADKAYTEVLGRSAGHPRAQVGKALVALERGETPNVVPPPGPLGPTTEAWFHLASGLAELGRAEGDEALAGSELDLARRGVIHDGRLALLYGRARLMQGKVAEAEEAMRIAERLTPNDVDVAVLDAEVALAKGFEDKVVTTLSANTSPRQLAVLGRALCLVGKYHEAEADLKAALARRPGDATAITYLAIARAHLGDAAGSQRTLEAAARTLHSTTPHYGLGLLAYERHDLSRARAELEKALAHNSEAFRARALLGRTFMELGKPAEALKELEKVAREAPALLNVHSALGRLYLTLGRDREARAELRHVIDAQKGTVDDKLAYAEATIDLGLVDEGEAAISDASDSGALAPKIARLRLLIASWKGPAAALATARALEKERKGPAARDAKLAIATADAWRRSGDLRKASEDLSAALLGDALHANLGLGRVQLAQNDFTGAEASYKAALAAWERGPYGIDDQTEARVGLGRALVSRRAFDEAVTTLSPAVTTDPMAPEPHFWLARALSEKNQLDKARAEAERATQLDDKYPDAFALYGDLVRMADPVKAKKAYKRYLELAPEGDKSKAVKIALKNLK